MILLPQTSTKLDNVTDIKPAPTLAVGKGEHHIGPIGHEGKRLMLELLDATNEAEWNGYDLFWADAP